MKLLAAITLIRRSQTGVVARITGFLFEQEANIEGLEERVTRGQCGTTIKASRPTGACNESVRRLGLAALGCALDMEI